MDYLMVAEAAGRAEFMEDFLAQEESPKGEV